MKLIQADYIFPVSSPPVKNGILRTDNHGTVLELTDPQKSGPLPEAGTIQQLRGILCPGFINSHCHLELSHLKGKISEKAGMTGFIRELIALRNAVPEEEIQTAINQAEQDMMQQGIVAVGDISNSPVTFRQKSKGHLRYHTFIELFDAGQQQAKAAFEQGLLLRDMLLNLMPAGHSCSLVPHASYTVSGSLFGLLNAYLSEHHAITSIHNQESRDEINLFSNQSGPLFDFLKRSGFAPGFLWSQPGINSLKLSLNQLSSAEKLLLVHNTYTTEADINLTSTFSKSLYWCLCVQANLFIDNHTPDIHLFQKHALKMTIGTDSLASNHCLSVLEEMKTISRLFPDIPLEDIVCWATLNGAEFFNFNAELGSFDPGKKPGINLIEEVVYDPCRLTNKSSVRQIM